MPKISIIVPVYNVEKYIAQCLDSIIKQTFRDIEVIVIDDGTQDNSAEIYQKYTEMDSRIKIIKKETKEWLRHGTPVLNMQLVNV